MEFVGSVNSTQVHGSQKTESTIAAEKKKKKTEETHGNADAALKCYPNEHL